MTPGPRTIELVEYRTRRLSRQELTDDEALKLHEHYSKQIEVNWPTPKNDNHWELRPSDSVGSIRVGPDLCVKIAPKIGLGNLFRMLEYAHDLAKFQRQGLTNAALLDDFFESLAVILAERVLRRARQGFHRDYIDMENDLPYVRGRINVDTVLRHPGRLRLPCCFEEHTADVEDNQILHFTLQQVARSVCLTQRGRPLVSKAWRSLSGLTSTRSFSGSDCLGRLYHRLNEDYRPLHALCRFFLESSGPAHTHGGHEMVPFLVKMNLLFERFVAEWLKRNLPDHLRLETQEHVEIGEKNSVTFDIDMVLYDRRSELPVAVLDTKYKGHETASTSDVQQILAYAAVKNCRHGFLVYPSHKTALVRTTVASGIHVETMFIPLEEDVEEAGRQFRDTLLARLKPPLEASRAAAASSQAAL